ncbi:MAG: type II toxin-antitoxin system RelE/ParE family toxin [Spirochaetales bacterium]|nr:type II toxin-antitoxin system RelE/ParE family toxin [Spirochaetales bacterium]
MYAIKLTEISAQFLRKLDGKAREQVLEKIEVLKRTPLEVGKQLKGNLKEFRSIRSVGQRYRIIYKVIKREVIVIVVAIGIRKEGDKKDVYELMKKFVKLGLFVED